MSSLLEWLQTWNWDQVLATIIAFVAIYGGSILTLVIALIKSKLRNFNFQEALEKKSQEDRKAQQEQQEKFEKDMLSQLGALGNQIMQRNAINHQERLQVLKTALGDADKATEDIEEIPEEAKVNDADTVLSSLGDQYVL